MHWGSLWKEHPRQRALLREGRTLYIAAVLKGQGHDQKSLGPNREVIRLWLCPAWSWFIPVVPVWLSVVPSVPLRYS